jgi:dienelactone hydrolase
MKAWRSAGSRQLAVMAGLAAAVTLLGTNAAAATSAASSPSAPQCDQQVGNPSPSSDAGGWEARDANNVACGSQRVSDQLTNPAFLALWAQQAATATGETPAQLIAQAEDPTRPKATFETLSGVPTVTDPFRNPARWAAAGRGRQQLVTFVASTGAHLNARLYSPVPSAHQAPLPAVVLIPGLQSYNETQEWFGEELAESGYVVLIIDPQGQGASENLPHQPDGSIDCSASGCPNVPTTDKPEVESAIGFMLSTPTAPDPYAIGSNADGTAKFNPLWSSVDPARLGIAGHSLGAIAVVPLGQQDPRVKAIVSFDDLDATYPADVVPSLHAPTLFFSADYAFPQPPLPKNPQSPPDPSQHLAAYQQLAAAGVDTMEITPRASTHYEWSYQPFPASLPASRLGELMSGYYTLAWFDRYLKGQQSALARLTATRFDASIDRHSIGAGTYSAAAAAAHPNDPTAGNVPYTIGGDCTANLLSFYYRSAFHLGGQINNDLRDRGCP